MTGLDDAMCFLFLKLPISWLLVLSRLSKLAQLTLLKE